MGQDQKNRCSVTQFIEATPQKTRQGNGKHSKVARRARTLLVNGIVDKVKNESVNHQSTIPKGLGS